MDRKKIEREILLLKEAKRRKGNRNKIYEAYRQFKGRYAVLIGGSGSGKSYEIADKQLDRIMSEDNHRILCCRNEQKQISESQVPLIVSRITVRSNLDLWKINLSRGLESITYLPNGNKFLFWGLDDYDKLRSIFDITSVWMEEADQCDVKAFRELDRRLRGYQGLNKNGTEKYMQFSFSFNPTHESSWLNSTFFQTKEDNQFMICGNQEFTDCEHYYDVTIPDLNEKITIYDDSLKKDISRYKVNTLVTHSTYLDNQFIDDTYSLTLLKMKETDEQEYNVFALGQWGSYGGNFFSEFRKNIHVIEPFIIPSHWKKYLTMDYGLDMLACYWIALDTNGNAFVYKELYKPDLIISEAARKIKFVNGLDNISIRYAPPDLDNRRQETGKSVFDIFREKGIVLTKSNNRRADGWLAMKEWLSVFDTKDIETGEPIKASKIKIFNTCTNLIRCLPIVQRAEDDANDISDKDHELTHSLDSLRYFCVMRQLRTKEAGQNTIINFPSEKPKNNYFDDGEITDSYANGGF